MKWYKLTLATFFLTFGFTFNLAFSQSMKQDVDLIQSIFGLEKKMLVAEFLGQGASNEFWTIYEQYEIERKILGQERLELLYLYVENYDQLTNELTDDMIKASQKLNKNQDKLIAKYTKNIKKSAGSKIAAQFYQFENYLLSWVRISVLGDIPLIGEFDPKY